MHFSNTSKATGSKFTKIAIVTALHLALGVALIHNMNSKVFTMPKLADDVVVFVPLAPEPPPPPPEPPKPVPKTAAPPEIVAPPIEVPVVQPPQESPVQATVQADPVPSDPGPVAPPTPPSTNTGVMRVAALADANGCATPDYPARAARAGETGTVSLALMIGVDGRVSDARVQKSSGSKELDRAAVAALSLCKFKPATSDGVPEPAWGKIAYVWSLD